MDLGDITNDEATEIINKRNEFWYARELMKVLSYKDWRYFDAVIEKAKIARQNSEITDVDYFVIDNKMVEIRSGAKEKKRL